MNKLASNFLDFISLSLALGSVAKYRNDLHTFVTMFKDRAPSSITIADVITWIKSEQAHGMGNAHIKSKVGVIQRFFRWLEDDGHVTAPIKWHTLPKLPKSKPVKQAFSEEQFRRVLTTCDRLEQDGQAWYLRSACIIAWHTGLRMSDCCLLQKSSLNFDDDLIRVVAQKKKQFGEVLEIPMAEELRTHLLTVLNVHPNGGNQVFPDLAGMYRGYRTTLESQFRKLFDEAGLPKHSFHSARHGFVSRMLNAGVQTLVIRSMTGQSLAILSGYSHVSADAKRAALGITPVGQRQRKIV